MWYIGDMKTATVREFKMNTSRFLGGKEDVMVTKRGRPLALVTPVPNGSVRSMMLEIGSIFREAGITKKQALATLEEVRREIYGPRRP